MKLNERQNRILAILEKKERVTVAHLAKALFVSEMTVRRDLAAMAREGLLRRYHGGAIAVEEYAQYPISMRMHVNEKEKRELAAAAERYIADGQLIYMSNSSTCVHLIPFLKGRESIRVVTNSVQFMLILSKLSIPCTLTGGEYLARERCMYGAEAEACLRNFNPDLAVISCDGITEDGRITVDLALTASLDRIAIRNATKTVVLADRSKLGLQFPHNLCHRDELDELIVF